MTFQLYCKYQIVELYDILILASSQQCYFQSIHFFRLNIVRLLGMSYSNTTKPPWILQKKSSLRVSEEMVDVLTKINFVYRYINLKNNRFMIRNLILSVSLSFLW